MYIILSSAVTSWRNGSTDGDPPFSQDHKVWNRGSQWPDLPGVGTWWGVHQDTDAEERAAQNKENQIQVRRRFNLQSDFAVRLVPMV